MAPRRRQAGCLSPSRVPPATSTSRGIGRGREVTSGRGRPAGRSEIPAERPERILIHQGRSEPNDSNTIHNLFLPDPSVRSSGRTAQAPGDGFGTAHVPNRYGRRKAARTPAKYVAPPSPRGRCGTRGNGTGTGGGTEARPARASPDGFRIGESVGSHAARHGHGPSAPARRPAPATTDAWPPPKPGTPPGLHRPGDTAEDGERGARAKRVRRPGGGHAAGRPGGLPRTPSEDERPSRGAGVPPRAPVRRNAGGPPGGATYPGSGRPPRLCRRSRPHLFLRKEVVGKLLPGAATARCSGQRERERIRDDQDALSPRALRANSVVACTPA